MSINTLKLNDFRNITHAELELVPSCNFIVGDNGSGKTSLLEAIYILSQGRSFRARSAKSIISHDKECFQVTSSLVNDIYVGMERALSGKHVLRINGENANSIALVSEKLPIQIINPDCIDLIAGGPKERRQFLDWGVFYHEGLFLECWREYQRVLQQRNACLRGQLHSQLKYWNEPFIELAQRIHVYRIEYFQSFCASLFEILPSFIDAPISIVYKKGWSDSFELDEILKTDLSRDFLHGYTHSGAHRADLRFETGGRPVCDVLSRGQLKLFLFALRLAQGTFLAQEVNKKCLYLIDDISSELDFVNLSKICQVLSDIDAQVIITCLDSKIIESVSGFFSSSRIFHIDGGVVKRI